MNIDVYRDKIFAKGKEKGLSDMELFYNTASSFDLQVFNQEIDQYSLNEDEGISFRAIYEGKMGYAYTEKLNEDSIDKMIEDARENAIIINKKEGEIYKGDGNYKKIDVYSDELKKVSPEDKIALIKELERKAFERDDRVNAVNYCIYSDEEFSERLLNSKGLDLSFKNNISYIYLSVVASNDKEEIKTASRFFTTKDFEKINVGKIANEAVDEAISLFGASSIPTNKYPVILRYDVVADILSSFSTTFSAENVQKGLSLFKGLKGEKVASDLITIIDDPYFKEGYRVTPFDGEGVKTKRKSVVENGVLNNYLYNLKTAKKDGVKSTGNAYRDSHKSFIGISPSNMYIQKGNYTYEQLISQIDEGIVVINVQGLHAGANSVSGDFSLAAYGYYVKNGKIVKPVEQITIAGNFLEFLKDIAAVGSDFKMSLPGSGHFGSPSLLIDNLSVAGE